MNKFWLFLLFILVFEGCAPAVFSKFVITRKDPDMADFYEPGRRLVFFPVLAKDYSSLDSISKRSRKLEEAVKIDRRHLDVIPFDDFSERIQDSSAQNDFLKLLNNFRRTGEVGKKGAQSLASITRAFETDYFVFLRLSEAVAYQDRHQTHKRLIRVEGLVWSVRRNKPLFSFLCGTYAKAAEISELPPLSELSDFNASEISRNLPFDSERALSPEKRKDW